MAPAPKAGARLTTSRGEVLRFKSPAEFFSENKNIAGFDNIGKSLYTTVRELVENALDACESIRQLPDIEITLEEFDTAALNRLIGVTATERLDAALYERAKTVSRKKAPEKTAGLANAEQTGALASGKDSKSSRNEALYYRVTVRDNGCGMAHQQIPDMLGRVLSGSKYGVRQTRGKFGLGAKMALIWSKQSTGMPVEVRSSTSASGQVSLCVLDIDIQKNEPRVKLHEKMPNESRMRGTEISLVVGGSWSTYRSYIVRYLRQMAVITPYARFALQVNTLNDRATLALEYARRSDEMPRPPSTIKHHPASLNLEMLTALLRECKGKSLSKFLSRELSCVKDPLAKRIIAELKWEPDVTIDGLSDKQILRLYQLLKEVHFPDPSANCLSPVGEYNLRLGIIKELQPDLVATFQDTACVVEGHPAIVEAGVSIGGRDAKPGITVYRFANRIPLLFEGGGDVATQVSKRKINWISYKIRQNQDKIGIFVSLVSTKVPFKGTGKEYIGDDIPEVHAAVKRAIERCCIQLKAKILKQRAMADERERKKNLTKYIPDVSRAFLSMMKGMIDADDTPPSVAARKRKREPEHVELLDQVRNNVLGEEVLVEKLRTHVEDADAANALETAEGSKAASRLTFELYLAPRNEGTLMLPEIQHPLFALKLYA